MSSPSPSPLQKIKNPFVQRRRSLPSVRTRATTRASLGVLVLLILGLIVNELRCMKYGCVSRVSFYSSDNNRGGYVGGGAVIKRPGEETEGGVEVETVGHGGVEDPEKKSYQEALSISGLDQEFENTFEENGGRLLGSGDKIIEMKQSFHHGKGGKKEGGGQKPKVKGASEKTEKIGFKKPVPPSPPGFPIPSSASISSSASSPASSSAPSYVPSYVPSSAPSSAPSYAPSYVPSSAPSSAPSYVPSYAPSSAPSSAPSATSWSTSPSIPTPTQSSTTSIPTPSIAHLAIPPPGANAKLKPGFKSSNQPEEEEDEEDIEEEITWSGREDDPPSSSHFMTPTGQEDPVRVAGNKPSHGNPRNAHNGHSGHLSTDTSPKFGFMDMGDLLSGS